MRLNLPRACRPQTLRPLIAPQCARRSYAFQASGGAVFKVFNSRAKWLQKERAATNPELSRQADYLKDEVAMRVCERLLVRTPPSLH
jgi:NADH dehydrogenase [ubiquinone] 1 alpha subcomplex assembly factor 5